VRIIAYPFRDTQGFYPKKVKSRHAGFRRECCKYAFASLIYFLHKHIHMPDNCAFTNLPI
jgi:hypothetical protein